MGRVATSGSAAKANVAEEEVEEEEPSLWLLSHAVMRLLGLCQLPGSHGGSRYARLGAG